MQFLSAKTLLYIRCVGQLWLAFLALTSPLTITMSSFPLLLGQAMRVPTVDASENNPMFGVVAVLFTLQAVSDLIPILAENVQYFDTVVPARLMFAFLLGLFCITSEYGLVANNLVFTYSFFEIWFNFLIYTNLRDDKYQRAKQYLEEHGEELRQQDGEQVVPVERL